MAGAMKCDGCGKFFEYDGLPYRSETAELGRDLMPSCLTGFTENVEVVGVIQLATSCGRKEADLCLDCQVEYAKLFIEKVTGKKVTIED